MADRAFTRVPLVRAKLAILATLLVSAWLTYRLCDVQIRQSGTLSRLAQAGFELDGTPYPAFIRSYFNE